MRPNSVLRSHSTSTIGGLIGETSRYIIPLKKRCLDRKVCLPLTIDCRNECTVAMRTSCVSMH